jgi:hypothetical protein
VWKLVPLCLLWCLWRERNDKSFEDPEITLEEIKCLFFYTLYFWTAAFVSSLVISYHDFLVFFLPLLARCFLMYTSSVLGGRGGPTLGLGGALAPPSPKIFL